MFKISLAFVARMIDTLLTEVADRGWYLYAMHQSPQGWDVSLRDTAAGMASWVRYGQGPTAEAALDMAISATVRDEPIPVIVGHIANPPSLLSLLPIAKGKVYRR